ncbi:MAG TPA: M20/M25/M40 family metallo-hydrolase [Roseiarcus sp.]|jgi:glutamate carboxypeptidase
MKDLAVDFNEAEYLARLRNWVEHESPTFEAAAVNSMLDLAARDFAAAGANIERIAGRLGFAGAIRARFPNPRGAEPGVVVFAHLDTVHPLRTLDVLPWRREGDRCYGPGILDMKGGLCLALQAVIELERAALPTPLPITFMLTGDEETGTPSARELVEREAARHRYVLVPEPARSNGNVISGRYAIARFNLKTTGRPSHAGSRLSDGRSAIRAMAQRILEIEGLSNEDCTFSVGVVRGGQWVNCVATTCEAEVLSMAKRPADLDRGVGTLLGMAGERDDVRFEVARGVTRPIWEPTPATLALFDKAQGRANELGFAIGHESAGGGSDGNFTGALGIPTLDGLGAVGDGAHTLSEYIEIPQTIQRGRLFADLLATIDRP